MSDKDKSCNSQTINLNKKVKRNEILKKIYALSLLFLCLFMFVYYVNCKNNNWKISKSMMSKERDFSTANILKDGTILVMGGNSPSNSVQIYNPKTDSFSKTISSIFNRTYGYSTVELLDGRIYVSGGCLYKEKNIGNCEITNTAEIYDPKTKNFLNVTNMNLYKTNHQSILLKNGNVLILHSSIVGYDSKKLLKYNELENINFEIYNPIKNSYYFTENTFPPFFNKTIFELNNGNLIIFGGAKKINNSSKVEYKNYIYDISKNRFINGPQIDVEIDDIVVQLDNNSFLCIKGTFFNDSFIYKIKENKKIYVKNFMNRTWRSGITPTVVLLNNGDVLILGMQIGNLSDASTKAKSKWKYTSYIYKKRENIFRKIKSPQIPVSKCGAINTNENKVILFGGSYRLPGNSSMKRTKKVQIYNY